MTLLKENSGAATHCEGRKRATETGVRPPRSLHNQVRPIRQRFYTLGWGLSATQIILSSWMWLVDRRSHGQGTSGHVNYHE